MKKSIIIPFLFFTFFNVKAQTNLVPNGDFELYSNLPTQMGQSYLAIGWNNVNFNYSGSSGSPDYFNILSSDSNLMSHIGAINPFSGNGQMGLALFDNYSIVNYREYISTSFTTSMLVNHLYKLSFYLTNGIDTFATLASNNFGIHFSKNQLHQSFREPIPFSPQIEIDTIIYFWNYWQYYSFKFKADSSYKFITLGNFRDDTHTLISSTGKNNAYYFIDKIEVIPILNIIGDSTICKGDTASLLATVGNNIKWAAAQKPNIILSTDTMLKVNPLESTTYLAYSSIDTAYFTVNVVNPPIINFGHDLILCNGTTITLNASQTYATYQWQDSSTNPNLLVTQSGTYWVTAKVNEHCQASDTIDIIYSNCEFPDVYIPNTFTPDGDGINDVFSINTLVEFSSFNIKIYNRWAQQVFESDDANFKWDGIFKSSPVPSAVYIYYIEVTDKLSRKSTSFKGRITVLY